MLNYKDKFIFIAGPCVLEDKKLTLEIAATLKETLDDYPFLFVFKASFDKANRTSLGSERGPGLAQGIKLLEEIKKKYDLPILSDVHCVSQIKEVKGILDVIQIPAFLCRQTDLIIEAAKTKSIVNIKKGQFVAPENMQNIVEKAEAQDNKNIWLTERGASFGYNNLVVDFRSFLIMKKLGHPVIYDATHSLQRPSAAGGISGGDREFVEPLAKAAVACGVDGLFMEVHPDPKKAKSDKHTTFPLNKLKNLLDEIIKVRKAVS